MATTGAIVLGERGRDFDSDFEPATFIIGAVEVITALTALPSVGRYSVHSRMHHGRHEFRDVWRGEPARDAGLVERGRLGLLLYILFGPAYCLLRCSRLQAP